MRIISLLPSATEIVCSLGLQDQLVGVTHECDFPSEIEQLPKVTESKIPAQATSSEIDVLVREQVRSKASLYTLELPTLEALAPDLIVTQSLCDVCAVDEEEVHAAARSLPDSPHILNLEPTNLDELFQAIVEVGLATNRVNKADKLVAELKQRLAVVEERSSRLEKKPSVLLLEWIDPPFSAGHWNPQLVDIAGGKNALGAAGERSQTIRWEDVLRIDPDVLFIACCGYSVERTMLDLPILRANRNWRDLRAVQAGRVWVADGSAYFNRPGPRLIDSVEILAHAIHPAMHVFPKTAAGKLERVDPER